MELGDEARLVEEGIWSRESEGVSDKDNGGIGIAIERAV